MAQRSAKKVLLIGWDAADWKVINPLMDAGLMPALERLVNGGVIGNLATLDPPLSPMLWTSIATGKTADQHGILGFTEPTPEGDAIRPVMGTSRTCKALWNMLTQEGLRSHVVGWWPSHPAEPINGTMVSNFYHRATVPYGEPWPLAEGSVHPPRLAETLAELRVHPGELTGAHLLPFVPTAAAIDQDKDKRLSALGRIIADAASVHAAATWVMEHEPWDFMAVYYDAIDHFGHGFMKFHPPRRPGIPQDLYDHYHGVIHAGYRFHDMMLERLLDLAGPDTTVILCSDHGFHPDHLRPHGVPKEPAGAAREHRDYGVIAIRGNGIRQDERIYGATLLDLAPTVLSLFGLPIGEDMAGRPLLEAYAEPPEPTFIPSWDERPGEAGLHAPESRRDPWAEHAAMQQLVELGYVEAPEEDKAERVTKHRRESQFYLARVHLQQRQYGNALPILETLVAEAPDQPRFSLHLAHCYLDLGRVAEARTVVDRAIEVFQREAEAQYEKRVVAWEKARDESGGTSVGERPQLQTLYPNLNLLQASLLLAEDRAEEAMEQLQQAEQANPRLPRLHLRIGDVYLKRKAWDDAERAFLKALTIDPDSAPAHHGLAMAYLRRERYEDAAEAALRAVGLVYFFPMAHFHLGVALMHLGYHADAAEAFEVSVAQAPGLKRAHHWLAQLYRIHLGDPQKAQQHLTLAS